MQLTPQQLKHNVLSELFFFFGKGAQLLRQKNLTQHKPLYYRKRMKKQWNKNPGFPDRRRAATKDNTD